jgi:hypothetical protein
MTQTTIDQNRWARMPLLDQMANIGAEVGRSFNARRSHREERFWAALQRALDLFEVTALVNRGSGSYRMREVARWKEEFLRVATANEFCEDEARRIEIYFLQLGVASRLKQASEYDSTRTPTP